MGCRAEAGVPESSWWADTLRVCPAMSAAPDPALDPGRTAAARGEVRGWGGPGSDEWQPALVHEKGLGGAAVKFNNSSAVGAKCGVWQTSHPHSFICVHVGQVFGGLGRMPATEEVEVACADPCQPLI
jgi:hypothetical protein